MLANIFSFYMHLCYIFNYLGTCFIVFGVRFQSLICSETWEERRGLGWARLTATKEEDQGLGGNNAIFWQG